MILSGFGDVKTRAFPAVRLSCALPARILIDDCRGAGYGARVIGDLNIRLLGSEALLLGRAAVGC